MSRVGVTDSGLIEKSPLCWAVPRSSAADTAWRLILLPHCRATLYLFTLSLPQASNAAAFNAVETPTPLPWQMRGAFSLDFSLTFPRSQGGARDRPWRGRRRGTLGMRTGRWGLRLGTTTPSLGTARRTLERTRFRLGCRGGAGGFGSRAEAGRRAGETPAWRSPALKPRKAVWPVAAELASIYRERGGVAGKRREASEAQEARAGPPRRPWPRTTSPCGLQGGGLAAGTSARPAHGDGDDDDDQRRRDAAESIASSGAFRVALGALERLAHGEGDSGLRAGQAPQGPPRGPPPLRGGPHRRRMGARP